MIFLIMTI